MFEPVNGSLAGKCIFCGFHTENGNKIDVSDNFMAWPLLQEGNCICEYCYSLVRNQDHRRKSWVANPNGIQFLQRLETLDVLLNPPDPPFAIYITKTGKKQGFIHLINRINYSRRWFYIAFDDSLILVDRDQLERMVHIAEKARESGFGKAELLGDIKVKHWEHRELCEELLKFFKNPLWEVVVYAVK